MKTKLITLNFVIFLIFLNLFSYFEAKMNSKLNSNLTDKSKIKSEKNLFSSSKILNKKSDNKKTEFLQKSTSQISETLNMPQTDPTTTNNYDNNSKYSYDNSLPQQIAPSTNSDKPEIIFGYARRIQCTSYNCPYPNMCIQGNTVCKCMAEFAEYELNKQSRDPAAQGIAVGQSYCSYKKKNQLVYFLLELFLNIGVGHFYAGNYLLGGLKITIVFLPCLLVCVMVCLGVAITDKISNIFSFGFCLVCLLGFGQFIWWLVDLIIIGIGKYTDGNGVPLNPW